MTVFTGTFKDLDFLVKTLNHVKIGRFSVKNRKIFVKKLLISSGKSQTKVTAVSGKFYNFLKKICRFLHENVVVFTRKFDDFCRRICSVVFCTGNVRFVYIQLFISSGSPCPFIVRHHTTRFLISTTDGNASSYRKGLQSFGTTYVIYKKILTFSQI